MIYVTITGGHVTIFQIRIQMLMKLVGQAKYPSTDEIYQLAMDKELVKKLKNKRFRPF
jgi:hypothetical protein